MELNFYQCVFRFFHSICGKCGACHAKVMPGHTYKVLHLSREIILANLKRHSKMQPLSRDQRPYLLTSLMNMSLVLRLPGEMHLPRSSSNAPRLPLFLEMRRNPHVLLTLGKVLNPLRLPRETTSERPKADGTCGAFNILTWTCASPHNGVRIFDISTSKSVRNLVCFLHFDLEMCFAPQWRALFRHLNFKKWSRPSVFNTFDFETCFAPQRRALVRHLNFQTLSEGEVFWTFWLRNLLCPTMACNFSSLIWPHGSAPAALASLLFDPPEPQSIGKTQCFATFLPFRAPSSSFFSPFLFSDLLSSALLRSDSSHLCFSICPNCRKFDF